MTKKRLIVLSSVALIALLLAGLAGVTFVLAQEATPTPKTYGRDGGGWGGFGWRGGGYGFGRGVRGQAELEAAAEALGMTTDELSTQLWGGRTLADLADKAGVDLQTVRDAVDAVHQAAQRDAIEQAVEDGYLSREQADWLLEGLEQGFFPGRRGLEQSFFPGGQGFRGPGFGPGGQGFRGRGFFPGGQGFRGPGFGQGGQGMARPSFKGK